MNLEKSGHSKKKLLVISCSKNKRKLENRPALEVYDGPYYRILRKNDLTNVDVLIVSAQYGLIDSGALISAYERRMTKELADEIKPTVSSNLTLRIDSEEYEEVFFELGSLYMYATGIDPNEFEKIKVTVDKGPIGVRLHNLKSWLNGLDSET